MQCQCPLKLRVTTVTVAGPSCPAYHNSMSPVSAPTVAEWAHMSHCHTVTLSHCHTFTLSRGHTVTRHTDIKHASPSEVSTLQLGSKQAESSNETHSSVAAHCTLFILLPSVYIYIIYPVSSFGLVSTHSGSQSP